MIVFVTLVVVALTANLFVQPELRRAGSFPPRLPPGPGRPLGTDSLGRSIAIQLGEAIPKSLQVGLIAATIESRKGSRWKPVMRGVAWQKSFLVLAALLAYAFLLPRLGFILCTAIFVAFMLKVVKPQGWPVVIVGGILAALGTYVIFELWLKAQLPSGPLGF